MICLDDIVDEYTSIKIPADRYKCHDDCLNTNRIKCKAEFNHMSADGLLIYFNNNRGYINLFEFKKIDIYKPNEISDSKIRKLDNFCNEIKGIIRNECSDEQYLSYKKNIKKIKSEVVKKHKDIVKLKAYESVHCVLPYIYKLYCLDNHMDVDVNSFKEFLINSEINFHLVYNFFGFDHPNKSRNRKNKKKVKICNDAYNIQRIRDFTFNNVTIVPGKIEFETVVSEILSDS